MVLEANLSTSGKKLETLYLINKHAEPNVQRSKGRSNEGITVLDDKKLVANTYEDEAASQKLWKVLACCNYFDLPVHNWDPYGIESSDRVCIRYL